MNTLTSSKTQTSLSTLNQELLNLGFWSVISDSKTQEEYLLMRIADSFARVEYNSFNGKYYLFFIDSFDFNLGNTKTLLSTSQSEKCFGTYEILEAINNQ